MVPRAGRTGSVPPSGGRGSSGRPGVSAKMAAEFRSVEESETRFWANSPSPRDLAIKLVFLIFPRQGLTGARCREPQDPLPLGGRERSGAKREMERLICKRCGIPSRPDGFRPPFGGKEVERERESRDEGELTRA